MKYLIFSFSLTGNEAKHVVDFQKNSVASGERKYVTLGSQVRPAYTTMCRIQDKIKKIKKVEHFTSTLYRRWVYTTGVFDFHFHK